MTDLLEIPLENSAEDVITPEDASPPAPKDSESAPVKAKAKGRPKGAVDTKQRKKRVSKPPSPPPSEHRRHKPAVNEVSSSSSDDDAAYYKAVRVLQSRQNNAQFQRREMYNRWVGLT